MGYTIHGDYSFHFGDKIFFILHERKSISGLKTFYRGFYYWELYTGLNGPFHSYNIAKGELLDAKTARLPGTSDTVLLET